MFRAYYLTLKSLLIVLLLSLSTAVVQAQTTVNANTASSAELQRIKGIGEKTAQRIIEERQRAGDYESVEDFALRVKGLGPKRAATMVESGLVFTASDSSSKVASSPSVVSKEVKEVKGRFQRAVNGPKVESYYIKVR